MVGVMMSVFVILVACSSVFTVGALLATIWACGHVHEKLWDNMRLRNPEMFGWGAVGVILLGLLYVECKLFWLLWAAWAAMFA